MSTREKLSLAGAALELRDEQLRARIVHYKADLATSPELDAITAQVVAELQALQRAAAPGPAEPADREVIEIELIATLRHMLSTIFREGSVSMIVKRKIAEASKRFARLFFESELCERIRGADGEQKTMRFGAQALFHVLSRNEARLAAELESFDYATPAELEEAKKRLVDVTGELRNEFLSATTPELNKLVRILNQVLVKFFTVELPPALGEFAWEVVKEGRLADSSGPASSRTGRPPPARAGYQITADAFPQFRATFERKFLERLVAYVEEGILERIRSSETAFRAETLRFVADPHIFTDVCALVCDAVYDDLHNDGFLDLPSDWRAQLAKSA